MITSEEARRIIAAAEQKAQEIGQPMNIAVVDAGRNLKAFSRMEDAWLGSIAISIEGLHLSLLQDEHTGSRGPDAAWPTTLRPQHH